MSLTKEEIVALGLEGMTPNESLGDTFDVYQQGAACVITPEPGRTMMLSENGIKYRVSSIQVDDGDTVTVSVDDGVVRVSCDAAVDPPAEKFERLAGRYDAYIDAVIEILGVEDVDDNQRRAIEREFIKAEPCMW